MIAVDILFVALSLLCGHYAISRVVVDNGLYQYRPLLTKLFYYHIVLSILFGWYVTVFGGDANNYWRFPVRFLAPGDSWLDLHAPGTRFIFFLAYPFSQGLGLSFFTGILIFSLFGFFGFICIFLLILNSVKINTSILGNKLFPLVLFLPNMHFWSGGIGKDSIIFFSVALFLFALMAPLRRVHLVVLSLYLAYFVRPHIALLMIIGLGVSLLVSSRGLAWYYRVAFLAGTVLLLVWIAPAVLDFIGLDNESIEDLESVTDIRSRNLSRSTVGSAIDISSYSLPLKVFTFLFRPLFIDATNVFGFFVSFENLLYLALVISVLRVSTIKIIVRMPIFLKTGLFTVATAAIFLSSSLGNLGIIVRQKNMVMFILVLICLHIRSEQKRLSVRSTRLTAKTAVDSGGK